MASRFVVLTYHRVLDAPDPLRPGLCHRARFASQLRVLKRAFNVLDVSEALARLDAGTLPARSVVITFDDGYRDNFDNAMPMLRAAGLGACFFVATGFVGDGVMWNDVVVETVRRRPPGAWSLEETGLGVRQIDDMASRRRVLRELIVNLKHRAPAQRDALTRALADSSAAASRRLMMREDEVRQMAQAGMTIGAHTVSHPILTRLDDPGAREEMAASRRTLENTLQRPVDLFAYPNGKLGDDYDERHAVMARECGFRAAFTTQWGYCNARAPRFEMPRVGLEDESGWRFAAKLGRAFFEPARQNAPSIAR
jgi:peptidoglycan/xylan/chitin deacetylase (PgdA/CDA1 family)